MLKETSTQFGGDLNLQTFLTSNIKNYKTNSCVKQCTLCISHPRTLLLGLPWWLLVTWLSASCVSWTLRVEQTDSPSLAWGRREHSNTYLQGRSQCEKIDGKKKTTKESLGKKIIFFLYKIDKFLFQLHLKVASNQANIISKNIIIINIPSNP